MKKKRKAKHDNIADREHTMTNVDSIVYNNRNTEHNLYGSMMGTHTPVNPLTPAGHYVHTGSFPYGPAGVGPSPAFMTHASPAFAPQVANHKAVPAAVPFSVPGQAGGTTGNDSLTISIPIMRREEGRRMLRLLRDITHMLEAALDPDEYCGNEHSDGQVRNNGEVVDLETITLGKNSTVS